MLIIARDENDIDFFQSKYRDGKEMKTIQTNQKRKSKNAVTKHNQNSHSAPVKSSKFDINIAKLLTTVQLNNDDDVLPSHLSF